MDQTIIPSGIVAVLVVALFYLSFDKSLYVTVIRKSLYVTSNMLLHNLRCNIKVEHESEYRKQL